jgi:hypothetical protein
MTTQTTLDDLKGTLHAWYANGVRVGGDLGEARAELERLTQEEKSGGAPRKSVLALLAFYGRKLDRHERGGKAGAKMALALRTEPAEVLPPEGAVPAVRDEWAERVAKFHAAAEQHAGAAVYCAAAAGAVMLQRKKVIDHGRFLPWVRGLSLPDGRKINERTSRRYMALAREMAERIKALPKGTRVSVLPEGASGRAPKLDSQQSILEVLASFDPFRVNELRQEAMAAAMKQVTGEQTLRQLYFDWGICREPARGYQQYYPRKTYTDDEIQRAKWREVHQRWQEIQGSLQTEGLTERSWELLVVPEQEALVSLLDELSSEIKSARR